MVGMGVVMVVMGEALVGVVMEMVAVGGAAGVWAVKVGAEVGRCWRLWEAWWGRRDWSADGCSSDLVAVVVVVGVRLRQGWCFLSGSGERAPPVEVFGQGVWSGRMGGCGSSHRGICRSSDSGL